MKNEIIECEKELLSAMKISDVNKLDKLLHDDLLFVTPDGQTITKAIDLEFHRSGNMVIDRISSTIDLINIIEDLAVVTVTVQTKGKMLNQAIEGTFKYIRIWKLCTNNWKVIGGSCTQI